MAQGSRYVFGYGVLLAPCIPIFMSGEEFASDYVPLPRLTPDLYGKGKPGSGRWLYGSWLQWNQVKEPRHAQMLSDVTKLLRIRRENRDLLHAWGKGQIGNILPLQFEALAKPPIPYVIWNERKAVVVAANPDSTNSLEIALKIPLAEMGWKDGPAVKVTDLWSAGGVRTMAATEASSIKATIAPDKAAAGGLAVLLLEPLH